MIDRYHANCKRVSRVRIGNKLGIFFFQSLSDTRHGICHARIRISQSVPRVAREEIDSRIVGSVRFTFARKSISNRKLSIRAGEYRGESIGRADRLKFASDSLDYEISRELDLRLLTSRQTSFGNCRRNRGFSNSFSESKSDKLNSLSSLLLFLKQELLPFLSRKSSEEYLCWERVNPRYIAHL